MREIKFRRFCFLDEKMTSGVDIEDETLRELESPTECVFMQFTGLLDKNGKEIYEGDVVRKNGVAFEIEYSLAEFLGTPIKYKYHEPEYVGGGHMDWLLPSEREIIGNIYENPELLK